MKAALAIALVLFVASAYAAEAPDLLTEMEAKARSARVSKPSYDVVLELSEKAKTYRGTGTLAFTLDAATADLRVDLRTAAVKSIVANGTPVDAPKGEVTRFVLPAKVLKAGENTVTVQYESGYDASGSGFHQFVDPVDQAEYLFSDFEPYYAHRLFPCFDQPDLKAPTKITVLAPRGWEVVSNAPEMRAAPEGSLVRHEFDRTPPISTYIVFVGAGPFAKFTDAKAQIPAHLYCRQSMKAYCQSEDIFDTTRRGLAFYGKFFGTPYPFKKYDQLFVPEFNSGAMENAGAVTFNEKRLFRHQPTHADLLDRASVILHEMAHMWFGDLVTMRWWDGLWLNESFATYMSCVALVKCTNYSDAFEDFLSSDKARAYLHDQRPTTHPVSGTVADTDTAFSNFDGITYGKGASLLKQLEFVVGEEAFRKGLAAYFAKHAWRNTETADFFAEMSAAAGHDLADWAALQFKTTGVNTVRMKLEEKAGRVTACWIEQDAGNGDGKLKDHRLVIAAYHAAPNGRLVLYKTALVTLSGAKTRVPALEGTGSYAFVWPNHQDQAYVKVALDAKSLDYALTRLERLPDGLTRRGVWNTFGEMVRDGVLAPQKYLDAFLVKAPLETNAMLIEQLFLTLHRVIDHYLVDDRELYAERVHQMAWRELERAKPASDLQKTWFDLAATTAVAPESLARLADLADGKKVIRGLELDPEKRWTIVVTLARRGAKDAKARIEAELKRDPTDMGQRHALTAEAAQPDAAVKASVWQRLMERKVSLDSLKAMMLGFHQPEQAELSRPYVDRFFEAILVLRTAAEQELNEAFVDDMFPQYVFDPAVVAKAEGFLAAHRDLSDDARKPIANSAEELTRALKIRGAKK